MRNGRAWTATVSVALVMALTVVSGTGCGKEDEKALRQGREAEALGEWQKAKECYARAVALDNVDGARRLAELLVKREGKALFGPSRQRDAEWLAEAEALTDHIEDLVRTAQEKGAPVEELEGTLDSYANAIRVAKEAEEEHRRAVEEAHRLAEEKAEAARRKAEEEALLKTEAEAEAARIKAEAEAKRQAEEAEKANALRNVLAKAKRAKEESLLINFYGFYVGMPLEDAMLLSKHYGFQEDELTIIPFADMAASLNFSLWGLRRLTKGGNTFDELAQAVADRIGNLKRNFGDNSYVYKTIDGNSAVLSEKEGLTIFGGQHIQQWIAKKAANLRAAVAKASKEKASLLVSGTTAGETRTVTLPGGAQMEMVWCPPGTFMMGSPEKEENRGSDEHQHEVTLTQGFWMAKTEVTQAQWKSVMGHNPSRNKGDDLPVEKVGWYDCVEFCQRSGLRLPTEAEWEYACRAGSEGPYAGTGHIEDMGWHSGNSDDKSHPVGHKAPNAWGIFDMHGNVGEWCADSYEEYPTGAVTNPTGDATKLSRVLRGGSFFWSPPNCRSATRSRSNWGDSDKWNGFRPCCSAGRS